MPQRLRNSVRLQTSTLSKLTNFMLGAAWAIALIGAMSAFFTFFKINLFIAILSMILGASPGLLIVLFLEYLMLTSETFVQTKKQTALLQEILEQMQQK